MLDSMVLEIVNSVQFILGQIACELAAFDLSVTTTFIENAIRICMKVHLTNFTGGCFVSLL